MWQDTTQMHAELNIEGEKKGAGLERRVLEAGDGVK